MLDYFWAGLPVVTTGGDALAAVVTESGAGIEVPAGDVEALAAALSKLLGDADLQAACRQASRRCGGGADLAVGVRAAGRVLRRSSPRP